ncbi:acetate/propionate family kinase [Chitinimonas naiadis]
MSDAVAVFNAGSSSIKFGLYHQGSDAQLIETASGVLEAIGTGPRLTAHTAEGETLVDTRWNARATHEDVVGDLIGWINGHLGQDTLRAVGHRVVHGGHTYAAPVIVDDSIMTQLQALIPLAPLHQQHNLAPMTAIATRQPALKQVACFDTSFHLGAPAVSRRYALPHALSEQGLQRYGFHGLSCEYLMTALAQQDADAAAGRIIIAHLGAGASLTAVLDGTSVANTMGFSTLDGLPMATRCGSLDPGLLVYLLRQPGMDVDRLEDLLYRQSGLLGVSGISGDMRTLLASGDPAAEQAIALFAYRIVREIGSLAAALGGLDTLVFTAGIGEHHPELRARIGQGCAWLGLTLDAGANKDNARRISTPGSRVSSWVIPTDEDLVIARHTWRLVGT